MTVRFRAAPRPELLQPGRLGEHVWIAAAVYRVQPEALRGTAADQIFLDMENLASIEVGRLPYGEAVSWLGTAAGIGPDGSTLAELYALKTGARPVTVTAAPPSTGLYL